LTWAVSTAPGPTAAVSGPPGIDPVRGRLGRRRHDDHVPQEVRHSARPPRQLEL